jgi:hypothetical protein
VADEYCFSCFVAFPALLLLLFVLPGLFFCLRFYQTENIPINYIPLTNKTAVSLLVTFTLHFSWILIIYLCTPYHNNYQKLQVILVGAQSNIYIKAITSISFNEVISILIYLITLYISAWILGLFSRKIIRNFELDKKFEILRLDSPWYYLFAGNTKNNDAPKLVMIAATIELAGKGYLYRGYLEDFF